MVGTLIFRYGSFKIRKIVPTTESSPTRRQDRCFYYAPDYNLNRFEKAQGFIASNHFNAKQSVVSFKGIFHVMSLSIGDSWIRTSTTGSLNTIRDDEQAAKGWKKGEIALPYEFQDLHAVHMISLKDLGRLLIVLVTRSIALSNTQYSLLLENEGRLVNLGSEWIGARVETMTVNRHRRWICYSGMLAPDDIDFTDYWGYNNDECEYFINGFVTDDRIYLQSTVFETTFELEMDFDLIELEFTQLNETGKIYVTSNPDFAFHDDVFPSFAKNQVTQGKFHPSVVDKKTSVPDNYFTSLAYFDHISSIIMNPTCQKIAISFDLK